MVKGITRQVIVVKGADRKLFDQAIFLVREDALAEGGITEEALLSEAKTVCRQARSPMNWLSRLQWTACGAAIVGCLWLILAMV